MYNKDNTRPALSIIKYILSMVCVGAGRLKCGWRKRKSNNMPTQCAVCAIKKGIEAGKVNIYFTECLVYKN